MKFRYALSLIFIFLSSSVLAAGRSEHSESNNSFTSIINSDNLETPLHHNLYIERNNEVARGEDLHAASLQLLNLYARFSPQSPSHRARGITYDQAMKLMVQFRRDPLYINELQYDPDRRLGLCFGRATYFHLQLLRYGVAKETIRKAFVVGPIEAYNERWQFHVGALVLDRSGQGWWVLDMNIGVPMELKEWYQHYKMFNQNTLKNQEPDGTVTNKNSIRLYITAPQKIGPSSLGYNIRPGGLFDYNGYFQDMFAGFRDTPIPDNEKLN